MLCKNTSLDINDNITGNQYIGKGPNIISIPGTKSVLLGCVHDVLKSNNTLLLIYVLNSFPGGLVVCKKYNVGVHNFKEQTSEYATISVNLKSIFNIIDQLKILQHH